MKSSRRLAPRGLVTSTAPPITGWPGRWLGFRPSALATPSKRKEFAVDALNHSDICTLRDVGPNYPVTELVEGETLRDWLRRAPPAERSQ